MTVAPVPAHGRWAADQRGGGRAVRVSARAEAGFLVLSTWKTDECVSTVRLVPAEAGELLAGIAEGLAHLADLAAGNAASPGRPEKPDPDTELTTRLRGLEDRLAALEGRPLPQV